MRDNNASIIEPVEQGSLAGHERPSASGALTAKADVGPAEASTKVDTSHESQASVESGSGPRPDTDQSSGRFIENDRLINADKAEIDSAKLVQYALNPDHPVGGSKARVFEAATGFNETNASDLQDQLKAGVESYRPEVGKSDQYGSRFTVDIPVSGPTGDAVVRTAWIYSPESDVPRMVTLYVK